LNKSKHNYLPFIPCYVNTLISLIKIGRYLWNGNNLQNGFYAENNIANGWTTNISEGYWYLSYSQVQGQRSKMF
jgi:hypothetical protein